MESACVVRVKALGLPFMEIRTWIKKPLHDVHVQAAMDQQTMTQAMQSSRKNSGIGAAETGESVTPGRIRERKR